MDNRSRGSIGGRRSKPGGHRSRDNVGTADLGLNGSREAV